MLAGACCGLLLGCKAEVAPPVQPRVARVIKVEPKEQFLATEASGQIAARYTSNVGFLVGGRLISRSVDIGASVTVGDVLARIDATDLENRLEAAQSQVVTAQANVDQASPQEDRLRRLRVQGYTTQVDYEQALRALQSAQAGLQGAQANLRLAQDQLKYAQLVAPSAGVVTQTGPDPGQVVQAGQMIVQLAQLDAREAVFAVSPQAVAYAHAGLPVRVWLQGEPASAISGGVREIAPNADPTTGTYAIKVALSDPPASFRLGAIVTGHAEVAAGTMIRIPSGALLQTGDQPQVWVVAQGNTVRRRPVKVLRYDTDSVLLSEGLAKDEAVVVAGVNSLADGQTVVPQVGPAP